MVHTKNIRIILDKYTYDGCEHGFGTSLQVNFHIIFLNLKLIEKIGNLRFFCWILSFEWKQMAYTKNMIIKLVYYTYDDCEHGQGTSLQVVLWCSNLSKKGL